MKKTLLIVLGVAIVVGAGAFYGGMKYGQSKISSNNFARQNSQNLTDEQRQQFSQENIVGSPQGRAGSNFLSGEVTAKDEQSLTLKTQDGSSKIIFFSDSTEISKTTEGSIDDIVIGEQIMVSGSQNSDGSYTAQTIQGR